MTSQPDRRWRGQQLIRCFSETVHGPVIVKRDLRQAGTLLQEHRILEKLQDVSGCPRLVTFDPARRELVVADAGGVSLSAAHLAGNLDLERFLTLAISLARLLAAVHARGVICRNLNPQNVFVEPNGTAPRLVDLTEAVTFAEAPDTTSAQGASAYMSPEQTGRMNRLVDYRTDLYSLGAILYVLATGVAPFTETDPLALVHAHLATTPRPPDELAPWLPPRLAAVISTLLAKEPDDRYQSARGLAHDLQALSQALGDPARFDAVPLRSHDLPLAPRPPRRMHGRSDELAVMLRALDDVTRTGKRALFVGGYSGVGKTTLIHELQRPVAQRRGLLASGKFEQLGGDRPFLAPAQCLDFICETLLTAGPDEVKRWRERLVDALGPELAALFEVVPELQALIGPHAPAAELGPAEARLRLRGLLVSLVREIAAPAHPLVLVLDDLQWADQASLDFLCALMEAADIDGLLVVGAWRDNEVDDAHPLKRLLAQAEAAGPGVETLRLQSLLPSDTTGLLADVLQIAPQAVRGLADLVYPKTGGNPFFTLEMVSALHREGLLKPEPERGRWRWDTEAIAARPASSNVVDFLIEGLQRLAPATSDTLVAAACLGYECTLGLLAIATGADVASLTDWLTPALEAGILVTPDGSGLYQSNGRVVLRFCHDQMQKAVYQTMEPAWRERVHLSIARRMAEAEGDAMYPFIAASHYAQAEHHLIDAAEMATARRLFLAAAVQARQASSFDTAESFLRRAIGMLGDTAWDDADADTIPLHRELHLVLYCEARHDEADALFDRLREHVADPLLLLQPACVQVMSLSSRTRYHDGIELACSLLRRLGLEVPLTDTEGRLESELDQFYRLVEAGALATLGSGPRLRDPQRAAVALLANRTIPAAFFAQPVLACWLALRCARLWFEEGYADALVYPVTCTILATISMRGDYNTGYQAANAAFVAGLARGRGVEMARAQHVVGLFNCHWFEPLERGLDHARSALEGLRSASELEFACFTWFTSQAALLDTARHVDDVAADVEAGLAFARKTGNRHAEQSYVAYRQLLRALSGATRAEGGFDDDAFDEGRHLAEVEHNPMAAAYYHLHRALAAAVFGHDGPLHRHAEAADALTPFITGFYPTALTNLVSSLSLARQCATAPVHLRGGLLERMARNQAWLGARAADAPRNFRHLFDLVEAERLDLLDQRAEALQAFERAMAGAASSERRWHLALATERAGRCYARQGLHHAGLALLADAADLYEAWGAVGKARSLAASMPHGRALPRAGGPMHDVAHGALMRASQALASETSLSRLVTRVVDVLGQVTGATAIRLLVMDDEGRWFLEAGRHDDEVLPRMPLEEAEQRHLVSSAVGRLGCKAPRALVSEDAVVDSRFAGDPHFAGLPLCSLLSLPIKVRGRLCAFLSLENRLYRGAFTEQTVDIVKMLCEQLAISIENARLYESLEAKVAERVARVKRLEGIIPICMICRKVRDDQQSWNQLEQYITDHSDAMFSHGMCPECFSDEMARYDLAAEAHVPAGPGASADAPTRDQTDRAGAPPVWTEVPATPTRVQDSRGHT